MIYLICILLFPFALHAENVNSIVEKLIAEKWNNPTVRVEWTFSGDTPAAVDSEKTWTLAEPLPTRLAGSLILKLQTQLSESQKATVIISGSAKIFGMCYTVREKVLSGQQVLQSNLQQTELEWTKLSAKVLDQETLTDNLVAKHALIPGRAVLIDDVKAAPVVRSGEIIKVSCTMGQVKVHSTARALVDGAIGETIPVMVNNGKQKQFKAYIQAKNEIQLLL